ncbi:MAG TPA: calcineurin-like phosphoesterase family protein [Armatimonadaceae bacterium]|nr:calcineurin-like phosphoesterase family protein [Armatimonadaceae bacterium]
MFRTRPAAGLALLRLTLATAFGVALLVPPLHAAKPAAPSAPAVSQSSSAATATAAEASGVVFEDRNRNRVRDTGEPGIRGVKVSNGEQIVVTDRDGRWKLSAGDDEVFFVIKPRGYMTPVNEDKLPLFYYVHKPNGSPKSRFAGVAPTGPLPKSIDFPLHKQREPDKYRILLFGDTQARDQKELDFMAHDVIEDLIGFDASFGMTLGDVVFDDLSLYPNHNRTIGMIGLPWYNVLGNHDINKDAADDRQSDETWERVFGPAYYSFDWGPVHFVALDDVFWTGPQGDRRGSYTGGLGPRQLEWLKRDLAMVPKNQLVVLGMHIPLNSVAEKQEIFRLLEQRPFALSLSAHTHFQEHRMLGEKDGWRGKEPHHHVVHATVCGSWWGGAPDERGIPNATMSDGAPNGYSVVTFDGAKYAFEFVPASRPASFQMLIHAPEEVESAATGTTNVFVNVFAGSERSKVEMRVGDSGPWVRLEQVAAEDPAYLAMKALEAGPAPPPGRKLPAPRKSPHLWRGVLPANLPAGHHRVQVRTTDMFGKTYEDQRQVRVK